MDSNFETAFIREKREKTPFNKPSVEGFFTKLCVVNGLTKPNFVSREDWRGLSEEGKDARNITLPRDLQLWEMVDVARVLDARSDKNGYESGGSRLEELRESRKFFKKVGIYLVEYSEGVDEARGRNIAKDMGYEFYHYGRSFDDKRNTGKIEFEDEDRLSESDKRMVDNFLLGDKKYEEEMGKLGNDPTHEQIEGRRKKMVSVYFDALSRKGFVGAGKTPWERGVGPRMHLQKLTKDRIGREMDKPESELYSTVSKIGQEKLANNIKVSDWENIYNDYISGGLGIDEAEEKVKLSNVLEIPRLRKELKEVREGGDIGEVSKKEMDIAKRIFSEVRKFPYERLVNFPSIFLSGDYANCVKSSMIGGRFMDQVGIQYLVASLTDHVATVVLTSEGKAYWQDFTYSNMPENYDEISSKLDDPELINRFVDDSEKSSVNVKINDWSPFEEEDGKDLRVSISKPDVGFQTMVLHSLGYDLILHGNEMWRLGKRKEARSDYLESFEVFKQLTINDENYVEAYVEMGNISYYLDDCKSAMGYYKKAISINPDHAPSYDGLGNVLFSMGDLNNAEVAFRKAVELDKDDNNILLSLGLLLRAKGDFDQAKSVFIKVLENDRSNVGAIKEYAICLWYSGSNIKALKILKELLNIGGLSEDQEREVRDYIRVLEIK